MEWVRDEMTVTTDRLGRVFRAVVPRVVLHAKEPAGPLRLGVWGGGQRLAGWSLPWLPAKAHLIIEPPRAIGFHDGARRLLPNFLRDWDGGWPRSVTLPHGTYQVTLDQQPERAVDVLVEVAMTAVSE